MIHKKVIVYCIVAGLSIPALAQRIDMYAIGGYTGSTMHEKGSSGNDFGRRSGGHGGILFAVGSDNVLFETGILYSSRGSTVKGVQFTQPASLSTGFEDLRMDFVDIPAMIVISPSSFRFFAGPQLSFLTYVSYDGNQLTDASVRDTFEKTTLGLRYGAGYIGHSNIVVEIHLVSGLTDIYKHPDLKWRNNSIQLAVGYRFFRSFIPSTSKSKNDDGLIPEHRVID